MVGSRTVPLKEAFMTTMVIDAKDLGIKYNVDQSSVVEPFDLLINFSYLNHSPLLPIIDS